MLVTFSFLCINKYNHAVCVGLLWWFDELINIQNFSYCGKYLVKIVHYHYYYFYTHFHNYHYYLWRAFLVDQDKESACHCRRLRFNPWVRKIPWRRKWQPTPLFLPGESHGFSGIPQEPGRLQSIGSQRVGQNWVT